MGPEDQHRSDMARIILKQKPLYTDQWRPRATIGQGIKSPTQTGSSANWPQQAMGLCCATGHEPGIKSIPYVLSAANDWKQGEYAVDDRHDLFHLEAFMFQRKYLRAVGRNDLADAVQKEIRQWWAAAALSCDQLSDPRRTLFGWAHQRTKIQLSDDGKSGIHYYWKRGLGISHLGTGLAKSAESYAVGQAPFNLQTFADAYLQDLRADVGQVLAAYKVGGFGLLSRWIVRGGRPKSYHWVRFSNGGYLTVQETDCGLDDMKSVVLRQTGSSPLIQFPDGIVPRVKSADDWAKLDMVSGVVKAYYKLPDFAAKVFSWSFDPQSVTLWVEANPTGVIRQVELDNGPRALEWEPEGGLPDLEEIGGGGEPSGGIPGIPPAPPVPAPPPPKSSNIHKSAGIYGWRFGQPLPVRI